MFVAREEKAFAVLVLVEEGRELARKRAVRAPVSGEGVEGGSDA